MKRRGFSTAMSLVAMAPFGLTAFLAQAEKPGYLEYGAFGLCAVLVGWMCKYIYDLRQDSKDQSKALLEIAVNNTKSFERWAALLGDRPCLLDDKKQIQGE